MSDHKVIISLRLILFLMNQAMPIHVLRPPKNIKGGAGISNSQLLHQKIVQIAKEGIRTLVENHDLPSCDFIVPGPYGSWLDVLPDSAQSTSFCG